MHHSRFCTMVIDCKTDDIDAAAKFWGQAFGKSVGPKDGDGRYVELITENDEPVIVLQQVEHDSRVHLDIETDDLDAEVARLEGLGAKRVAFVRGRWWVMEAPTGHKFCIVQRQRAEFGPHLNEWP
jgi:predicted enzyme related to lactoylglutathione lyase